ncbi:hypothetical protein L1275_002483 [Flavobacterium sp. HSC-61S13]|nr:hypothetical protein [Flavobacterium sp. HSC-61S13]
MYDSLTTLIEILDISKKSTSYSMSNGHFTIKIENEVYMYPYDQTGISKAIKVIEDKL